MSEYCIKRFLNFNSRNVIKWGIFLKIDQNTFEYLEDHKNYQLAKEAIMGFKAGGRRARFSTVRFIDKKYYDYRIL